MLLTKKESAAHYDSVIRLQSVCAHLIILIMSRRVLLVSVYLSIGLVNLATLSTGVEDGINVAGIGYVHHDHRLFNSNRKDQASMPKNEQSTEVSTFIYWLATQLG